MRSSCSLLVSLVSLVSLVALVAPADRAAAQAWPARPVPASTATTSRADASRAQVGRADVSRADASRAQVGRAHVGRAEAGRAEAGRAEAGRAEADRTEVAPAIDARRPTVPPRSAAARTCPGPSAQRVIAAALATASLEAEQVRTWRSRLAWSSLLPQLGVGVARTVGTGTWVDIYPDQADKLGLHDNLALRWDVRATWDLARLVFDPRELRISHQAGKLVAERRRMIERVASLYFERCRYLTEGGALGPTEGAAQTPTQGQGQGQDQGQGATQGADGDGLTRTLRVQELTAILDALTGGLLSREPGP